GLEDHVVAAALSRVARALLEQLPVEQRLAAEERDLAVGRLHGFAELVDGAADLLERQPGAGALIDRDVAIAAGQVAAIGQIDGQMIKVPHYAPGSAGAPIFLA